MTVRQIKEWVKQRKALTDTEEQEEQEQTEEQEEEQTNTEEQEEQTELERVMYVLNSEKIYALASMLGVEPQAIFDALDTL